VSYPLKLKEIDLKRLGFVEIWDIFKEGFKLKFSELIWGFYDLLEKDNNIYIIGNPDDQLSWVSLVNQTI